MGKVQKKNSQESQYWNFTESNYILFSLGIVVIICGYLIMATSETNSFESTKLAPIILLIGYIVIIPLAILCKFEK